MCFHKWDYYPNAQILRGDVPPVLNFGGWNSQHYIVVELRTCVKCGKTQFRDVRQVSKFVRRDRWTNCDVFFSRIKECGQNFFKAELRERI